MDCIVSYKPLQDFNIQMEAAGCVCVYKDKILFLQKSPAQYQEHRWGVPSGKLQQGETPTQGMLRELKEETGFIAKEGDLEYVGRLFIRVPAFDYIYHMFHKTYETCPFVILSEEHQEARWATLSEIETLPLMLGAKEALAYYQEKKEQDRQDRLQRQDK